MDLYKLLLVLCYLKMHYLVYMLLLFGKCRNKVTCFFVNVVHHSTNRKSIEDAFRTEKGAGEKRRPIALVFRG